MRKLLAADSAALGAPEAPGETLLSVPLAFVE